MIRYRSGYKYQLAEDFETEVSWHLSPPDGDLETEYITLASKAAIGAPWLRRLVIRKGYAWDGASKPAINTKTFRAASAIHDALYQLMRQGFLPFDAPTRIAADVELIKQAKLDGMMWLRRQWVWAGLRVFAKFAADPKNAREIIEAP